MKLKPSLLILLFASALLFTGCKDKAAQLAGSWKVNDLKYTKQIPKHMQDAVDVTVANLRTSFVLTYNTDGTYFRQMNGNKQKGKWKLNWNASKISSTNENEESFNYDILELSENKFSFKAIADGEDIIFEMVRAK